MVPGPPIIGGGVIPAAPSPATHETGRAHVYGDDFEAGILREGDQGGHSEGRPRERDQLLFFYGSGEEEEE